VKVSIIGQGYVGSELGKAAKKAGHQVLGIEVNPARLESLSSIGYPTSSNYAEIKNSEIVVITVPTPLDEKRNPDLSHINNACESMLPYLSKGTLIINESTSYPGTLREIIANRLGSDFIYASAPERVDPGNSSWGINNTPRLLGALTEDSLEKAVAFYESMTEQIIKVSSPEVAEAAKLFENTFRQVNIALVNEFAQITQGLGISSYETLNAANTKPYGIMKFFPGIGVGGHCIPIDPTYLSFKANQVGVKASFIELANKVNLTMTDFVANKIDSTFNVAQKNIQIAGLAYKANVSDVRESPSLKLISLLRKKGALVSWNDDLVGNYAGEFSTPIHGCHLAIICVNHEGVDYTPWLNSKSPIIDVSSGPDLGWGKFI
jgi:UDP-N-acetyl-D-glucosamine dehydrogenase